METCTPKAQGDGSYTELSFTLPAGHRLNQPRSRSEFACPKTHSNIRPDGLEMHGFRSRAAEVLNQYRGVAWLLREMPNTATGELELRIAVKGKFLEIVRNRIIRDLQKFHSEKIEESVVPHRL